MTEIISLEELEGRLIHYSELSHQLMVLNVGAVVTSETLQEQHDNIDNINNAQGNEKDIIFRAVAATNVVGEEIYKDNASLIAIKDEVLYAVNEGYLLPMEGRALEEALTLTPKNLESLTALKERINTIAKEHNIIIEQ